MDNYPSNSLKSREEAKPKETKKEEEKERYKKVTRGKAKTRKQPAVKKLSTMFLQEDMGTIKEYIIQDVLIPSVKNLILDSISMALTGSTRSTSRRKETKVSYSGYYDSDRRREEKRKINDRRRKGFDYDEIVFDSRGDAQLVLDNMDDAIDRYGVISIFDMFDMAGMSAPYTYQDYGWTDIREARIVQVMGGDYVIEMPRAIPIR